MERLSLNSCPWSSVAAGWDMAENVWKCKGKCLSFPTLDSRLRDVSSSPTEEVAGYSRSRRPRREKWLACPLHLGVDHDLGRERGSHRCPECVRLASCPDRSMWRSLLTGRIRKSPERKPDYREREGGIPPPSSSPFEIKRCKAWGAGRMTKMVTQRVRGRAKPSAGTESPVCF